MGRIAVAAIVSLWAIPISILVDRIVPDPYMDEIFHIPQVQQYCKGNFRSWDPMITTPAGLYYVSLVHIASLFPGMSSARAASSIADVCSTAVLRSINGVLAVICSVLFYDIMMHLKPSLDKRKATLSAVVLALYPPHWFFTFLYYTDVASLTAVLAMYLACLKKNYRFSALLGAFAVLIRQTNVIWVLFVACTGIINYISVHDRGRKVVDAETKKSSCLTTDKNISMASNLRRRKLANPVIRTNSSTLDMRTSDTALTSGLLDEFRALLLMSWHLKWELLASFSPFFIVLVAFAAFVYWNGSVVLGAKEAHAVSPHFAQIMYFGLVTALAMAPLHFTFHQASGMFSSLLKNSPHSFFLSFLALLAGFLSVHFFSIAHPYLVADNRHYPFYLWRKVIRAHWLMKYIMVPVYTYSWLSVVGILRRVQTKIWVLVYFLATAAVLVPAPLIEFRYFTIPFVFLILHSPLNDLRDWLVIGLIYIAVNAFTMAMFLFRPFRWEHEPGIQRFIW